ncbi:hypothetical protein JQK15_12255 [Sphingobium sp. BHU LFT2]|uniref:DUF6961 family protein n=1 Tax=Sphingobium sp. BHU LFT2 TaxID=2807634 RepID=UPI001BE7F460|nr:hypothetical protein [Sphingobium sp. BHU LFT2]MBT2244307.1 hypothetical protein [Sphingobium sp. BHU LFT2]
MTLTQVPWGAASMLIRTHGDHATAYADKRISALAAIDDVDGVAVWKKIANCINQLSGTGSSN